MDQLLNDYWKNDSFEYTWSFFRLPRLLSQWLRIRLPMQEMQETHGLQSMGSQSQRWLRDSMHTPFLSNHCNKLLVTEDRWVLILQTLVLQGFDDLTFPVLSRKRYSIKRFTYCLSSGNVNNIKGTEASLTGTTFVLLQEALSSICHSYSPIPTTEALPVSP